MLARRLGVELGDDPPKLVERAAGPLAILLRELRPLRADQAGDQGDRESESAREHAIVLLDGEALR
jgi:hypothetical protein